MQFPIGDLYSGEEYEQNMRRNEVMRAAFLAEQYNRIRQEKRSDHYMAKTCRKACAKTAAIISLVLVFAFMFIAAGFNNDWGAVEISDVYYPNSEGGMLHGQLFVPKGTSSANPVPGILNMHGGSDYLQTVSNYSLELARRGYVVMTVDAYGSGNSDFVNSVASNAGEGGAGDNAALKMDGGASIGIDYMLSFAFVDKENVGLTGHSMGGTYIANAALDYADQIKAIMPWGSGSFVDKMKATPSSDFQFSVGYINAQSDEMVVFASKADPILLLKDDLLKNFVGTQEDIVSGKVYGSFEEKNARVIYTPDTTHIGNIINKDSIAAMVNYFGMAMPTGTNLGDYDQVWMYKEAFGILSIAALTAFIISLGFVLADTKFFADIKKAQAPAPIGGSKLVKLAFALVCMTVPALTLHKLGLWLAGKPATAFLPMNWANNLMWLAVINAVIMLALFLVWHFVFGKKNGSTIAAYGFMDDEGKFSLKMLAKSLLLALILIGVTILIVNLCYSLFKIDFRFWQFGIMPISVDRMGYFANYAIFFIIALGMMNVVCTAFASVGEEGGAWKQYLISWLIGAGGFTFIMVVYYVVLGTTRRPPFFFGAFPFMDGHPNSLVYSMKTTVLVPTFTILTAINTSLYRKTKNVYIGWFTAAFLATLLLIGTNAFAC